MKRISWLTSIVVVISLLLTVMPAKAADPDSFYMKKTCGASGCVISEGTGPFSAFDGTTAAYTMINTGFDSAGNRHMTAFITLNAGSEGTLSGIVSWVYHNGEFTGHISLQSGTGSFEGIHAEGDIGLISWPTTFSFSGQYVVAP